jgi:hypothetical protein
MDAEESPVLLKSEILTSCSHSEFLALVIIAKTECPTEALNTVFDNTTAGRLFTASRSVNGKGTTTTENGSKIGIRFVVRCRVPFGQSILQRLGKSCIDRRRFTQMNSSLVDFKNNRVAFMQIQDFPDLLGNDGLIMVY